MDAELRGISTRQSRIQHSLGSANVLVAGAGGFIGGHLVRRLVDIGVPCVRAVDVKPLDHWCVSVSDLPRVECMVVDLRELSQCHKATHGCGAIFNLAADMGGMGFIETHKADCMLSVLINTNLLRAAATE